jgi:DNA polymerase-1
METKCIAIIDADSIVWSTAYEQAKTGGSFRENITMWFYEMFNYIGATHYIGVLGGNSLGRRKVIVPSYKASRPPKPNFYLEHGDAIENYLLTQWDFIHSDEGYEADDTVASWARACRESKVDHIVCGVDKDLLQIEGRHYNYDKRKQTLLTVSEATAAYNLLKQTLTGDSTDNIPGLPGIGPAKADKILADMSPYNDVWSNTMCAYTKRYGPPLGAAKFAENYLMVRLEDQLPVDLDRAVPITYPV